MNPQGKILDALSGSYPSGLTRTKINRVLNYKVTSTEIARALQALMDKGLIRGEEIRTKRRGRPTEIWYKR